LFWLSDELAAVYYHVSIGDLGLMSPFRDGWVDSQEFDANTTFNEPENSKRNLKIKGLAAIANARASFVMTFTEDHSEPDDLTTIQGSCFVSRGGGTASERFFEYVPGVRTFPGADSISCTLETYFRDCRKCEAKTIVAELRKDNGQGILVARVALPGSATSNGRSAFLAGHQ
jgi:hypothetical protein